MDATVATRPMTEILKAADAPLPTKTNGQPPPPITREEAEAKLLAVIEHIRTTTAAKISNVRTQLDNLEKELDLHSMSTQDGLRDLFKLVGSFEMQISNMQDTIEEIAKKHLQ